MSKTFSGVARHNFYPFHAIYFQSLCRHGWEEVSTSRLGEALARSIEITCCECFGLNLILPCLPIYLAQTAQCFLYMWEG